LNKWKKVIIGTFLFAGFVIFTQYEKNAEPAWKVNEKEFTVVKTFNEGIEREYLKFEELEIVNKYGFLQKANKSIQLRDELRTLKFEKIWNIEGRLYMLYSVDLKERDKDERDIPRLTVKKIKLSTKEGKDAVFSASENTGFPGKRDEGFVYKHRLYRSMMVIPMIVNHDQMDWNILIQANRFELQDVEISTLKGSKSIKNIPFKVSSENLYTKVLESSPINKTFTYGNNKIAEIKSYDVLLYDRRLSLDISNEDEDLVAFSGYTNNQKDRFTWDIIGTEAKGYYLPSVEDYLENDDGEKTITFHSSMHKNAKSYSWTIHKEDINRFNKNMEQTFIKNEEILNQNKMKVIYEGFSKFNGEPAIQFSVLSESISNRLRLNPESIYGRNEIPEEYKRLFHQNLLTITNESNEQFSNYEMHMDETETKTTYYINFFKEDRNGSTRDYLPIPEERITITLSDLVYSKPLPTEVTIKYKVPKLKK
jgi:hypothetical protein